MKVHLASSGQPVCGVRRRLPDGGIHITNNVAAVTCGHCRHKLAVRPTLFAQAVFAASQQGHRRDYIRLSAQARRKLEGGVK